MATWKKIITSGSAAELSSLTLDTALPVAQGGIGATSLTDKAVLISQDSGTDAVGAVALTSNGQIIIGGSGGPAAATISGTSNEVEITNGANSITIGLPNDVTIAGDLTVQGGDITLTNAATDIDLIDDNSSALSFDAAGKAGILEIDTTNSAEKVKMSGDLDVTGTISGSTISGSFIGDGSNLTGVGFQIDELSNTLTAVAQADLLVVADADGSNEEKKITFSNFEDQIFSNINAASSDIAIAAGGAITLANNSVGNDEMADNAIGNAELKQNEDITLQALTTTNNLVVGGDLTVNGTTTTVATTNTKVEDQLMFLGTGSAGTNKDVGIVVQSGSTDLQGSAFYNDTDSERWSVAKGVNHNATSITPLQFVTTVKTDTVNPDTTSGSYGAGEMHVNTSTGDIWIRYG